MPAFPPALRVPMPSDGTGPDFARPDASAKTLTMVEAIRDALARHPSLTAARLESDAVARQRRLAGLPPSPHLTLAPWIGGPNGTTEEFFLSLSLESSALRRARVGVADASVRESLARRDVEALRLAHAVAAAYVDLAHALARRETTRELLALAGSVEALAARQVELGARPGIERTQLTIETARLRRQLDQDETQFDHARIAFNAASALPQSEPAPVIESLEALRTASVALGGESEANSVSAALRTIEAATEDRLRAEARRVRSEGAPALGVALRSQNIFRQFRPSDRGAAFSISLPLNPAAQRERERQSEFLIDAQIARRAALQIDLTARIASARRELLGAETALRADDALIEDVRKLLAASQTGFRLGQTALPAYLEAQRTGKTVLGERLDTLRRVVLARLELARIGNDQP